MFLILVAIGLAVAGAVTENTAFYWLAGIVVGFVLLFVVFVGSFVRNTVKETKSLFDNHDDLMSQLRSRQNRRFR